MTDHDTQEELPSTGSMPTDAHLAMNALMARVLLEVARRRQEELPGLTETLQDSTLITSGGTKSQDQGCFAAGVWKSGDQCFGELFLNADWRTAPSSVGAVENVLDTLLHEACHAYAHANGIPDTCQNGRYHNRRFAEIAIQIGLEVVKDPRVGHMTIGLSARGRIDYADLLAELERGLVLVREPQPRDKTGDDQPDANASRNGPSNNNPKKYVFASCRCEVGRGRRVTLRMAAGYWRSGAYYCRACDSPFEESLSTGHVRPW